MKKIDWDSYKFRASQVSKIAGGTIGITEKQEVEIQELINERDTGVNVNGNKIKWTVTKKDKLADLLYKKENPELPKTMQSELRKIHRAETFNRNFVFTNKFVQKGIAQEEEGITVYQLYRKKIQGINSFFIKNTQRLYNELYQGEPDLSVGNNVKLNCKEGDDIKCSWSLDSFPFPGDPLENGYEWQDLVYMDLTGARLWRTVHVLVNATETLVDNEKKKYFYAMGAPSEEDKNYPEYVKKAKEVERMLIFDYERFTNVNPYHLLEYSKEEWNNTTNPVTGIKGLDIPLENRVVIHEVEYDRKKMDFLDERVKIAREYLKSLDKQK